jgi:uncharacterized low-complexity protein
MENKKLKSLAASTLALGALGLIANPASAANLFTSTDLGTGAELRSEVLGLNDAAPRIFNNTDIELKCGEGKCGEEKKAEGEKAEGEKAEESKAGESKCGEEKKAEKKVEKTEGESKSGEHKCGEGKCGM